MYPRSWLLKLAVFFIPGVLFLIYICFNFSVVKEKVAHLLWEEPKITNWVLVGVVCFIAGGVIDFLRATVISLIQWIGSFRKQSISSSEKLRIFDSLTNRTYGYQYLGFNISLSILVVWGLFLLKKLNSSFWITVSSFWITVPVAFSLLILTGCLSRWNKNQALSRLKKASQQNEKREGDTSCLKECPPKDHRSDC